MKTIGRNKFLKYSCMLILLASNLNNYAQCLSGSTYTTCTNSYTFTLGLSSAYTYIWNECDAGGSIINANISTSTMPAVSVTPTNTFETHNYNYSATIGGITCMSGVFTVIFDQVLPITSNHLATGATLSTSVSGYSSFQWNLNGSPIGGATSSSYVTTTPGTYTLSATSATCGGRTSNSIVIIDACYASITDIHSCSNMTNLNTPGAGGIDYQWYVAQKTLSPGPSVATGSYNLYKIGSTITLDKNDFSSNFGTFGVYYTASYLGSNICTSPTFEVTIDDIAPAIIGSSSTPTSNIEHNLYCGANQLGYTSYQWYRNGSPITAATSTSYVATAPGSYSFNVYTAYCGSRSSNNFTIDCGTTTYNNYTFSTGVTNISSTIVVIEGRLTIPEDATVNISSGSKLFMKSCSEIVVEKGTSGHVGGILTINNSEITSCDKWNGIIVEGYASGNTRSASCSLNTATIKDAKVGLYAFDGATIDILATNFINNYRHVQINNHTSASTYTTINGGDFNYLMQNAPSCGGGLYSIPDPIYAGTYRNCIYLEDADKFLLKNNNFEEPISNAIVIQAYSNNNTEEVEIENDICHGSFAKGIWVENYNSIDMSTIGTTVSGDFNDGMIIENTSNVEVSNASINTSTTGNTGLRVLNANTINLNNNTITNFINGIECYHYNSTIGTINLNSLLYNTYGLVLASNCHPVGNPSCNSYASTPSLDIRCNKIRYNTWGIIGVGGLPNQGSISKEWGTFFEDGSNPSDNAYSDIAWYTSGTNPIIYYYNFGGLIFKPDWLGSTHSIMLDGNIVTKANLSSYLDLLTSGTLNTCNHNFIIKQNGIDLNSKVSNISPEVFPNPFNTVLSINNPTSNSLIVTLFDITGRSICSKLVRRESNEEIETSNFNTGIYILKYIDLTSGLLIGTTKVVKY